jgi:hypothetical protein
LKYIINKYIILRIKNNFENIIFIKLVNRNIWIRIIKNKIIITYILKIYIYYFKLEQYFEFNNIRFILFRILFD